MRSGDVRGQGTKDEGSEGQNGKRRRIQRGGKKEEKISCHLSIPRKFAYSEETEKKSQKRKTML